jgi:hypothetical protein
VTDRHDVAATVPWMREGTARLLAVVDKLGDEDLAGWLTGRITAPHRPPLPRWL